MEPGAVHRRICSADAFGGYCSASDNGRRAEVYAFQDADERRGARNLVVRVVGILAVISVTVQAVNYLVVGSNIGSFDMSSCEDLLPTTTHIVPTTSPTTERTTTTAPVNGTTTSTTSVSSTTSTSTTLVGGSCADPGYKYSIYGNSNACQRASSVSMCNTDYYPNGGNDITDLDDSLGAGFSQCCCDNGYPGCCGIRKILK